MHRSTAKKLERVSRLNTPYLSILRCMCMFRRGTPSSLQTWGRSSFGVHLRFRGDKLLASETRLLIEDRVLLVVRFINKTTIPRHSRERSRDRSRIKETMFCSSRIGSKAFSSHVNGTRRGEVIRFVNLSTHRYWLATMRLYQAV